MFSSQGYYAALQAATPGYTPTPRGYPTPQPEGPGPSGVYDLWGRPLFPLSAVRTFGGYGPMIVTPSPVIMLPPAPPLIDYVQVNPASKKRKR